MVKGIGIDIVQVNRVSERLASKVLCDCENFESSQHFAGLWAVKEAVLKAFGCGVSAVSFKDIAIIYDELGAPKVQLGDNARDYMNNLGAHNIHVSISHEKEYAVAMAVME